MQVKTCFEITKKRDSEEDVDINRITCHGNVVKAILVTIKDKTKKRFRFIRLKAKNKIIRIGTISAGAMNASLVHP
ncbi:MAG: hypothetical protein LBQ00_05905 [Syntrophobacterales bacterium]|nr:hypothetical protein [Syntrophobacterales bacterium]